jgi:hypothetical protein
MDNVKRCSVDEAIKMLLKGALVFTDRIEEITEEKRGCRKCSTARKGNYCFECGSKITDKLKVKTGRRVTSYRFSCYTSDNDEKFIYMETMEPGEKFYGDRKKCTMSLEYFLNFKHFSWIWP